MGESGLLAVVRSANVPLWLVAASASLTVFLLAWYLYAGRLVWAGGYAKRAASMLEVPEGDDDEPAVDTLAWRMQKAGFRPGRDPQVRLLLWRALAAAVPFVAATALGFPPLLGAAFAAVGWGFPGRLIDGRIRRRARGIDRELPLVYVRLAALLQTQPQGQQALQAVVNSMEMQGVTPLSEELRTVANAPDFGAALTELERRSPTPSLAHLAFALRRYHERGASVTFASTLGQSAARLTAVIAGRNKAQARASDARMSIVSMVGVMLAVYLFFLQDPVMRAAVTAPLLQGLLLVLVGWMYLGFTVVQSMIDGVE